MEHWSSTEQQEPQACENNKQHGAIQATTHTFDEAVVYQLEIRIFMHTIGSRAAVMQTDVAHVYGRRRVGAIKTQMPVGAAETCSD